MIDYDVVLPLRRRRRRRPTALLVPCLLLLSPLNLANFLPSASAGGVPEIQTGTTIFAVKYRDGVVVGADTRTSVSGYVSNRYASKLAFVLDRGLVVDDGDGNQSRSSGSPNGEEGEKDPWDDEPCRDLSTCAVLRSGSSADTQSLADACRHQLLRRSVLHGRRSGVSDAARLLRALIYNEPDLSASLICAGWDHTLARSVGEDGDGDSAGAGGGEGVIYSISPGGSIVEEKDGWAIGGSGSTYLMAHVDSRYPHGRSNEWTEDEAVEFVAESIGLAMDRDGSSGGLVRIWVIDRRGGGRKFGFQVTPRRSRTNWVEGQWP
eukprot:CAMPEP_0113562214 /NCGR_PEP_ID=MMETSP0015_2-20120614/20404_1 /TAXON_ID=2838 /ORGANISM="Odontella" /LENGTH=320 /DNA_ID=CAMNT_0000464089 /DNA_START=161 /DNA_END=1124 /DNA_ORIENTATION=- /assembly_acc=CAM_ASM_000160